MSGITPLRRNEDRAVVLPVKYGDNLWLREMSDGDIEAMSVRKIKMRCRVTDPDDPSDPSAPQTTPIYGPLEIPGLEGRKIVGAFAHPFTVDPSGSFDPSNPDPSAGDIGVVRPMFAIRGPRCISFGLFSLDDPGQWPGGPTGSLVTPSIKAAAGKHGLVNDWPNGPLPATSSYLRETVVDIQQETDPSAVDFSDPSSIIEYQLMLSNGSRIRVEVPATEDQPELEQPWPLDRDDSRFNYQVLDSHQYQEEAFPRRNAFVVPNVSDDPLHGDRNADNINRSWVTAVRDEFTQNPVEPSAQVVQRVSLSDGRTVTVPTGVLIVPGMEFDPSGMDPSEGDPSGLSPEALDPTDWWEFEVFLVLVEDDSDGDQGVYSPDPSANEAYLGTQQILSQGDWIGAGYHADNWPLWPDDLGLEPSAAAAGGALEIIIA